MAARSFGWLALLALIAGAGCGAGEESKPPASGRAIFADPGAVSRTSVTSHSPGRVSVATASSQRRPGHLLVDLSWDGGGFRVERTLRVENPLPKRRGGLRGLPWRYRVVAVDGRVVHEGELADPSILRGEFHGASGGPIEGVHGHRLLPAPFSVRVPDVDAERIEFFGPDPLGDVPFPRVAR